MKKILLATDFSSNAKNALRYALDMFNHQNYRDQVEFILVHVQPAPFTPIPMDAPVTVSTPQDTDQVKEHESRLKAELEEIRQLYPYVKIESLHLLGAEVTGLTTLAEEQHVDLIVVGTLGKSMLERTLIGSTAVGVSRHANCSVLVVPGKATFKPFKRMVLATDMQKLGDMSILQMMQNLVFNFEPEVYILHVFGEKEQLPENRELINHALKIYFNTNNYRYYYLENENPAEGIGEFVSGHQADLLAMIGQNRNFFTDLFHRSVTKQIVVHSRVPVLILHKVLHAAEDESKSSAPQFKLKETLLLLKRELEELNLQLHLSKAEAADELAEIKRKLKSWLEKSGNALTDLDDEIVIKLRNALVKVNEKLQDLKGDSKEAFENQKEQLRFTLSKVQELIHWPDKNQGIKLKGHLEDSLDQLKTKLDELMLDINLGKMEIRDEWLEKEKVLRKKMNELRHRLNAIEDITEEKWNHFRKEMSTAVEHAKKAFADTP